MSKNSNDMYCTVPEIPEREFGPEVSIERASLIRTISKKWVNGTVLHYYFFDTPGWKAGDDQKKIVRQAFDKWKKIGIGIEFKEVSSANDAEIRIGFAQGDGSWSYVGRDILNQGLQERTMNFGWNLARSPRGIDTAIHEIGHTLGFPHEHQNPNAGIVWDEEAVYEKLGGPPNNWSREKTHWNIIRKISPDSVDGTKWDYNSIMHYPFGPGLIREPKKFNSGLTPAPGLSKKDIAQVKYFYPELEEKLPELEPFKSQMLSIKPGKQKNFAVKPESSRIYNFRTFGNSDTVMVLFEDNKGELIYIKGNDDSGTNTNASIETRLYKGRNYVLKVRLYYNFSSGNTALMYW